MLHLIVGSFRGFKYGRSSSIIDVDKTIVVLQRVLK